VEEDSKQQQIQHQDHQMMEQIQHQDHQMMEQIQHQDHQMIQQQIQQDHHQVKMDQVLQQQVHPVNSKHNIRVSLTD